mgnify:CR=1 FL=1
MSGEGFAPPLVVTGSDYRFIVTEQLQDVGITPGPVLIEPEARNTAPAILAAALHRQAIFLGLRFDRPAALAEIVAYRDRRSQKEKAAVARAAADLLPAGPQTVGFTGGTTTSEIARVLSSRVDLVVVEGFKREPHRKIEVYRAENGKPHPVTGARVILTCAHIYDDRPEACSLLNLQALCQKCHNGMDGKARAAGIRERREKAIGQLLFDLRPDAVSSDGLLGDESKGGGCA